MKWYLISVKITRKGYYTIEGPDGELLLNDTGSIRQVTSRDECYERITEDGRSGFFTIHCPDRSVRVIGTIAEPGQTGDIEAPSVPQNVQAVADNKNQITVTWDASTDDTAVTGYHVFRNSIPVATLSPTTIYVDTDGVLPDTFYSYTVVAFDAAGNTSDESIPGTVTTPTNAVPQWTLIPDADLIVGQAFNLNLSDYCSDIDIDDILSYSIVSGNLPTGISLVGSIISGTPTNAGESSLITVRADDGNDTTDTSFNMITYNPDVTAPPIPTGLFATQFGSGSALVSWNASIDSPGAANEYVSNAVTYDIYRDGSFIANTASLTYTDTGLSIGVLYSYQVLARDISNNISSLSDPFLITLVGIFFDGTITKDPATVDTLSFELVATASFGVSASAVVEYKKSVDNTWQKAPDAVRVREDLGSGYSRSPALNGILFGLESGTEYDIRVTISDVGNAANDDTVTQFSDTTRSLAAETTLQTATQTFSAGTAQATIEAAINAGSPGDIFEFSGDHTGLSGLSISANGTLLNPIYIRGDGTVVIGDGVQEGMGISGDYIVVEDLSINGNLTSRTNPGVRIIGTSTAPNRGVTLRRCNISAMRGVTLWEGSTSEYHDFTAYNNTLVGVWPWATVVSKVNGNTIDDLNNDDGMRLTGQGHSVFNNTFSGFGDAVKVHRDTDILNIGISIRRNKVLWGGDDGFELDDSYRNVIAYENFVMNTHTVGSKQPNLTTKGINWFIQNVGVGFRGRPWKLQDSPGGVYLSNNTLVTTIQSVPNQYIYTQFRPNAENIRFYNNLWVHTNSTDASWEGLIKVTGNTGSEFQNTEWDGSGYLPDGAFTWDSEATTSLADAQVNLSGVDGYQGANFESQGVVLTDYPFANDDITVFPAQGDWTERGTAISPGTSGWDIRLDGAITPCVVLKKNGTFYLYYIGADGNRSTDGGPRHRALGVATSTNGINFTKYSGNPVITHLPWNNEEEGVFSAGGMIDDNGDFVIYYGAMDAGSPTSTNVDVMVCLATSSDGFNFNNRGDTATYAYEVSGEEMCPVGVIKDGSTYICYYIDAQAGWKLRWLSSTNIESLIDQGLVSGTPSNEAKGSGEPMITSGRDFIYFVDHYNTRDTLVMTGNLDSPGSLTQEDRYTWGGSAHRDQVTIIDRELRRWIMYYRDGSTTDVLKVKTAPLVGALDTDWQTQVTDFDATINNTTGVDSGGISLSELNGGSHRGAYAYGDTLLPYGAGGYVASSGPTWFEALADLEWTQINNNTLADVKDPLADSQTGNVANIVSKWCGMATDPIVTKSVALLANGGHNDYSGNEVYYIGLSADAPVWVRKRNSSVANTDNSGRYADGRPSSAHTYVQSVGAEGRFFNSCIGSVHSDGGSRPPLFEFDIGYSPFTTISGQVNDWIDHGDFNPDGNAGQQYADYDPVNRNLVIGIGRGLPSRIRTISIDTGNLVQEITTGEDFGGNYSSLSVDPDNRKCVVWQGSTILVWNLDNLGAGCVKYSTTGTPNNKGARKWWHAASGAFLSWEPGSRSIYKFTPNGTYTGGAWSTVSGNGVTPSGNGGDGGMLGKVGLIQNLDGQNDALVILTTYPDGLYACKIPGGGI